MIADGLNKFIWQGNLVVLDQFRLTFEDLVQYSPRHSSSQALPSPISPKPSECNFGWRDRWWLNKTSQEFIFELPDSRHGRSNTS